MNDHSLPKKIRGNFRRTENNQNKLRTVLDGSIIVKVAYKARDKKKDLQSYTCTWMEHNHFLIESLATFCKEIRNFRRWTNRLRNILVHGTLTTWSHLLEARHVCTFMPFAIKCPCTALITILALIRSHYWVCYWTFMPLAVRGPCKALVTILATMGFRPVWLNSCCRRFASWLKLFLQYLHW